MCLKILCLIVFMLLSMPAYAIDKSSPDNTIWLNDYESMAKLLTEVNYNECIDIYYNATRLIPDYYSAQKYDSIGYVMSFMTMNCNDYKNLLLTKILLSIKQNNFTEALYSDTKIHRFSGSLLEDLFEEFIKNRSKKSFLEEEYHDKDKFYIQFLKGVSNEIKNEKDEGSLEYLWSLFLAGDDDEFVEKIVSKNYEGTVLQELFFSYLNNEYDDSKYTYGIMLGGWYPNGNLQQIGNHFEFGLIGGFNIGSVDVSMYTMARPGSSKNAYEVKRNDGTIALTDEYHNLLLGLDILIPFKRTRSNTFFISIGVGLDEIYSIHDQSDDNKLLRSSTFNYNSGLELRHYWNLLHTSYVSLYAKYNVVNFHDKIETDLSGNVINVGLKFGWKVDELFSSNHYPFW